MEKVADPSARATASGRGPSLGMGSHFLSTSKKAKVFPRMLRSALRDRKVLDGSDAQLVLPHLSAPAEAYTFGRLLRPWEGQPQAV
jgi:hypothetical protein